MNTKIYHILDDIYGNLYGGQVEYMTETVENMVKSGTKWSKVRNYLWMNTSGGGVSVHAADKIREAFPDRIEYDATGREL